MTKWVEKQKYTKDDLRQRQSLPLEQKITLAKKRIKEWYDEYGADGVYVSFSGGKDSVVLLDLVKKTVGDVPVVYVDTGLEYPEVRANGLKHATVVLKPSKSFRNVIQEFGYPVSSKETANKIEYARKGSEWALKYFNGEGLDPQGRKSMYNIPQKWKKLCDAPFKVSSKCCNHIKKSPIHKYQKETGRLPYLGMHADESRVRAIAWQRTGCNAYGRNSQPLATWTESDVFQYVKENNLEIPSIYGEVTDDFKCTGINRTGCMFCMFGVHLEKEPNRFQRMKKTHPKQWEYCMKPFDEGGLGLAEVLDYIGVDKE